MEGESGSSNESVRVDLWAWSARLFKTRTEAAAACKKAQILVNGQRCRAAKLVRVGDEIRVRQGLLTRILEVKGLAKRRVGAKEVPVLLLDRTPEEEYLRVAEFARAARDSAPKREAGTGRPTKRDRRELDEIVEAEPSEAPTFEAFVKAFLRRR